MEKKRISELEDIQRNYATETERKDSEKINRASVSCKTITGDLAHV